MPDYPQIDKGTRFQDTKAAEWRKLVGDVEKLHDARTPTAELELQTSFRDRRVAVVKEVDLEIDVSISVREIRYDPSGWPRAGVYVWGREFQAFPDIGLELEDYDRFLWEGDDPTLETRKLVTYWNGAYWVVEAPPVSNAALQLRVVALETDRLLCVSFVDGVEGEEQIYVALPWWLRTNPHDGSIRNGLEYAYESPSLRMVTREDAEDTRIQEESIVPSYTPGDIIYVLGVDHTDVLDPEDSELSLIDMNVDGRVWAEI